MACCHVQKVPGLLVAPNAHAVEPLLPIEKKLIAWSLATGLVLLVVLAAVNHYFPPTL